jgi:hypothetical protein
MSASSGADGTSGDDETQNRNVKVLDIGCAGMYVFM